MTCHHRAGDPNCSSSIYNSSARADIKREVRAEIEREMKQQTPDAEKFEIEDVQEVGSLLVLKVKYPNCANCAYESNKVMVFENVAIKDVLKWKRIDPHFREVAGQSPKVAPPPIARFPASPDGWEDAMEFSRNRILPKLSGR